MARQEGVFGGRGSLVVSGGKGCRPRSFCPRVYLYTGIIIIIIVIIVIIIVIMILFWLSTGV